MILTVPPAPDPSTLPHLPYFFDMCACVASWRLRIGWYFSEPFSRLCTSRSIRRGAAESMVSVLGATLLWMLGDWLTTPLPALLGAVDCGSVGECESTLVLGTGDIDSGEGVRAEAGAVLSEEAPIVAFNFSLHVSLRTNDDKWWWWSFESLPALIVVVADSELPFLWSAPRRWWSAEACSSGVCALVPAADGAIDRGRGDATAECDADGSRLWWCGR
jgi:hypothetical protein